MSPYELPNPFEGVKPGSWRDGVNWCTVDDGKEWFFYEVKRKIVDALYYACTVTVKGLQLLSQMVTLLLPSGIRIPLMIDGQVPDFRLPEKKFWAWSLWIGGHLIVSYKPLPKDSYKTVWQNFVRPWDIQVGTGEYIFFDVDGELIRGSEMTPPRKYGLFEHGVIDAGSLFLIIAIANLLIQSGLVKTAKVFATKIFTQIKGYKSRRRAIATSRKLDKLIEMSDIDSLSDEFKKIKGKTRLLL
jgi:hypothetical protein